MPCRPGAPLAPPNLAGGRRGPRVGPRRRVLAPGCPPRFPGRRAVGGGPRAVGDPVIKVRDPSVRSDGCPSVPSSDGLLPGRPDDPSDADLSTRWVTVADSHRLPAMRRDSASMDRRNRPGETRTVAADSPARPDGPRPRSVPCGELNWRNGSTREIVHDSQDRPGECAGAGLPDGSGALRGPRGPPVTPIVLIRPGPPSRALKYGSSPTAATRYAVMPPSSTTPPSSSCSRSAIRR